MELNDDDDFVWLRVIYAHHTELACTGIFFFFLNTIKFRCDGESEIERTQRALRGNKPRVEGRFKILEAQHTKSTIRCAAAAAYPHLTHHSKNVSTLFLVFILSFGWIEKI